MICDIMTNVHNYAGTMHEKEKYARKRKICTKKKTMKEYTDNSRRKDYFQARKRSHEEGTGKSGFLRESEAQYGNRGSQRIYEAVECTGSHP